MQRQSLDVEKKSYNLQEKLCYALLLRFIFIIIEQVEKYVYMWYIYQTILLDIQRVKLYYSFIIRPL